VKKVFDAEFALPNLETPLVIQWQLFGQVMPEPILELSSDDMAQIAENLRYPVTTYVFIRKNGDQVLLRANPDGAHTAMLLDLASWTKVRIRRHIAELFGYDSKAVDPEDKQQFSASWPLKDVAADKILQLPKKWVEQIAKVTSLIIHVLRPLDKESDVNRPVIGWNKSKKWLMFRDHPSDPFRPTMPSPHGWEVAAPSLEIRTLTSIYERSIQPRTSSAIQLFASTPAQIEELKRALDAFLQFQRRYNAEERVESCIMCGNKATQCDPTDATRAFCASKACVEQYFFDQ